MVKRRGRPPKEFTEKDRRTVSVMVAAGINQENICKVLQITRRTLAKHFKEEIETAGAKANTKIAQSLYQKALQGDTTALIWWTKTRMRWSAYKPPEEQPANQPQQTVLVVPGMIDADSWSGMAEKAQKQLLDKAKE